MQTLSPSLRIGVLRGGPSPEYDVSLKTGAHVLKTLGETHRPLDILISKDGTWHVQGIERSPERILSQVDVVWNGLHGAFGEDGKVQEILNAHGVKYTGSDKYPSAIAMNKHMTKEQAKLVGIKTPIHITVRTNDDIVEKAKEIFYSIPNPLMVKPGKGGSSIGIEKADSFATVLRSLENILATHDSAVVEEYITGKPVSCLVTEDFRGEKTYAFPLVENFSKEEKKEIENSAKKIHNTLGLRHYSSSDFVVSPRRGLYFLETNTSPKFDTESHLLQAIEAVGVNFKDFIFHIIHLAVYETGLWL